MTALGFEKNGRIFNSASVAYTVEFPPGPLSIGEENQIKPVELRFKTGNLLLLSPTDSVKDRLTGYFYDNDAQCLEQAVLICQMNKVDMEEIRRWAKIENRPEKYKVFEKTLHRKKDESEPKNARQK